MSVFEILRDEIDLVELAEGFTELKASGNTFRGWCPHPQHDDQNPSFHVYPDGHFHCFGCCWHGDAVDLWAGVKHLSSQIEAAVDLAREYDIALPEINAEQKEEIERRRTLEAQHLEKAKTCHSSLPEHPEVAKWWESRGFSGELREKFLLGANEKGEATIPFWNRGRVHGIIRRKLRGEPKYVLPEAEEFPLGYRPLFIPTSTRHDLYLVEGYVDALALAACGVEAIAIGGTGMSKRQREDLIGMCKRLYVLPDNDELGMEAARQWVKDLYPLALLCNPNYETDNHEENER